MKLVTALTDLKHGIRARIPLSIQDRLSFRHRARRHEALTRADPDIMIATTGNDRRSEAHEWFRGDHTNFMPSRTNLFEKDAIENYVLKGWLPEKPFISKAHYITPFGSCFAANVTNYFGNSRLSCFRQGSFAALLRHPVRRGDGQ